MKMVEIEWIDAQSCLDCFDLEELKNKSMLKTKSCGYLVHEDKEKVILAFMLLGEECGKHFQIIPKGMVKKIKILRFG